MLGLQCISFYLPNVLWEIICNCRASGDVFTLIQAAKKAASGTRNDRKKEVERVAEFLEDMLDNHKCPRRVSLRINLGKNVVMVDVYILN